MDAQDDPYEILGVSEDASDSAIKKAYRKLALQHHPDRTGGDDHQTFAKISNAYELLSDPQKKRDYDQMKQQQQQNTNNVPHSRTTFSSSHRTAFPQDFFAGFHDPMDIFQQVFQQEFGNRHSNTNRQQTMFGNNLFEDPFFQMSSMFAAPRSSLFQDPFFAQPSSMMMMNNINMNHAMPMTSLFDNPMLSSGTSFSTMSSSSGMPGGTSVSTSTTTRIVNGQRQTVTERVVQHADGRVERQVQTNGHNDRPALPQVVDLTQEASTRRRSRSDSTRRPSENSHKKRAKTKKQLPAA